MTFKTVIKDFYHKRLPYEDKVIFVLIGVTLLVGLIYILINTIFTHYTGNLYLNKRWLYPFPVVIGLAIFAWYTADISPRWAFFTRSYSLYFFIILGLSILTTGLQFTPFPRIDLALAHADQSVGFQTIALLNWTYAHQEIKKIMGFAYTALAYELFFVPLIVALMLEKRAFLVFLLSLIISYFIGSTIYYFFPTAGPSSVFSSPYFSSFQHDTLLKFIQVHHRHPLSTYAGGMIAFPSYHVIWSIILAYATLNRRWIFIPLALFNIVVILSTLFLGWHFLMDVWGGIVVGALSIGIAEISTRKINQTQKQKLLHNL